MSGQSFFKSHPPIDELRVPGGCDLGPNRAPGPMPSEEREALVTARERLNAGLLELAEQGQTTPGQGRRRDRWTSDDRADREWAAAVCVGLGCPLLVVCRQVGADEGHQAGVWGGLDQAGRPGKTPTTQHPVRPEEQPHKRVNVAPASSPGETGIDEGERGHIPPRPFSALSAPGRTGPHDQGDAPAEGP